MKQIAVFIVMSIILVGIVPFIDAATKIQWTIYLGMPLIILTGSFGVAFISKRIEVILAGVIISALLPMVIEVISSV